MIRPKNKYEQIYEHFKLAIESKIFVQGDLLPTDNQIAQEFNSSRPTVARAISQLVADGMLKRKPGYGTTVLDNSNKPLSLGLLIPGLGETEIFEPICGQIAALAAEHNFSLIWGGGSTTDDNQHSAIQMAQRFANQDVDGIFFTPVELVKDSDAINKKIMQIFKKASIPVILLDADIIDPPLTSKHDLIGIDNTEAGYIVTKHLIQQGCKTIGFLNRSYTARTVAHRLIGARLAVEQSELPNDAFQLLDISGEGDELADRLAVNAPDGIVSYNDVTAATLMPKLIERGIRIPEDVRIVGIDDVKYASMLSVPLTTYHQPCEDIGKAAVSTMIRRIRDPKLARIHILLRGELIVRKSSQASLVVDPV